MTRNKFTPIENWDQPRDGLFAIITNRWWVMDDDGRPIVYDKCSPQCNPNHDIALRIANGRPLVFLPVVYLPINPRDYV